MKKQLKDSLELGQEGDCPMENEPGHDEVGPNQCQACYGLKGWMVGVHGE